MWAFMKNAPNPVVTGEQNRFYTSAHLQMFMDSRLLIQHLNHWGFDDHQPGYFNCAWLVDGICGEVMCVIGPSGANVAQMNNPFNASSARPEKILMKLFSTISHTEGPRMCTSMNTMKRAGRVFSGKLRYHGTNPSVLTVRSGDVFLIFNPRNPYQRGIIYLSVPFFSDKLMVSLHIGLLDHKTIIASVSCRDSRFTPSGVRDHCKRITNVSTQFSSSLTQRGPSKVSQSWFSG